MVAKKPMMDHSTETRRSHMIFGMLAILLLLNCLPLAQAQPAADPCKGVSCGQGQCAPDVSLTGYRCDCDPGWTQIAPLFPFLSCFIPNCTLNFSCDNSTAPAPALSLVSASANLFPPLPSLSWCSIIPGICGSGDCVEIPATGLGLPSYECDCHKGSSNLLNSTSGPCLPSCGLTGNCSALNLPLSSPSSPNGTTAALPPSANQGNKQTRVARGLTNAIFITSLMWLCS